MAGYGVQGVANPRVGNVGALDAVNQQTVDQKIAAGALYQGTYKPATNNPNLWANTDSGFTPPVGGQTISDPGGTPPLTNPADILVWFDWSGNGFDAFPATPTAPTLIAFTYSDGTRESITIPAHTYNSAVALQSEIDAHTAPLKVKGFLALVVGGKLWLGGVTLAPLYMTSVEGQAGGGFPMAVKGANATVLNTYNWVVATFDPNAPEYAPPGLPGIAAGQKLNNSDLLQWNGVLNQFDVIRGGNLTQTFADNRYWQLANGNMAWRDQIYAQGAVVYGTRFNAWFVSTQNIIVGSPEPGTTAAAASWRKINSTYGATVFFGKGDYDPTDTTAANNWGMPPGTYPSGQQPLNGDSYFDVTTGTTVNFLVTQNPPSFTISGVLDPSAANSVSAIGNTGGLDAFPGTLTFPVAGRYYSFVNGATPYTIQGGLFAGRTIPANRTAYFVSSGDPDADNRGWVMLVDDGSPTWRNWSVNTPHPQNTVDTISSTVVWGNSRRYTITFDAGAAKDSFRTILKDIPNTNQAFKISIRDKAADGSVYVLEFASSKDVVPRVGASAIKSNNPHIAQFGALQGLLVAKLGDGAANASYDITISTEIGDVGNVKVGNGTEGADYGTTASKQKADEDYPNASLDLILKGDAPRGTVLVTTTGYEQRLVAPFPAGTAPTKYIRATGFVIPNDNARISFGINQVNSNKVQLLGKGMWSVGTSTFSSPQYGNTVGDSTDGSLYPTGTNQDHGVAGKSPMQFTIVIFHAENKWQGSLQTSYDTSFSGYGATSSTTFNFSSASDLDALFFKAVTPAGAAMSVNGQMLVDWL
jgi:hypothetical protein